MVTIMKRLIQLAASRPVWLLQSAAQTEEHELLIFKANKRYKLFIVPLIMHQLLFVSNPPGVHLVAGTCMDQTDRAIHVVFPLHGVGN